MGVPPYAITGAIGMFDGSGVVASHERARRRRVEAFRHLAAGGQIITIMTASSDSGASPAGQVPTEPEGTFSVTITLEQGYRFDVDPEIPGAEHFHIDESPPLGEGSAPSPSRVLASAMASCLASSLTFCLRKARIELRGLRVTARGTMVRNERKRLRVGSLHIELFPEVAAADEARMQRCLEIFEDFCVVTESVRSGIPVVVGVETRTS